MHTLLYISRTLRLAVAALTAALLCSFTVVIDAGHGGKDAGTVGAELQEKDINLDVALRVGKNLQKGLRNTRVVFTRATDVFIPLQERCNIANREKGDIFVSIHTNSVDLKSPNRLSVNGASVYTLGLRRSDTNLEVAMRENSVMRLEDDYTTTYAGFDPTSTESYIIFELNQSVHMDQSIRLANFIQNELCQTAGRRNHGVRQEPFWVLVRTAMPAVLVELDFICNPDVEAFLGSNEGRDKLAAAIANGIMQYEGSMQPLPQPEKKASQKEQPAEEKPAAAKPDDGALVYRIQFLTSPTVLKKGDSRLKGIPDVDYYRDGATVKYVSGTYPTLDAAKKELPKLRKLHPDAFVIKMQNGHRVK
ncbi:MAG: N-acetylmuramoyl-L-alanine amidase [Muribaculaceae bacterium]|nr:N-acetylmuramoyl-L-alanine amidase [Muribaculaceae bacterium]